MGILLACRFRFARHSNVWFRSITSAIGSSESESESEFELTTSPVLELALAAAAAR